MNFNTLSPFWTDELTPAAAHLVDLAWEEDLRGLPDCTTVALVPEAATGAAVITARQAGIAAGLPILDLVRRRFDPRIEIEWLCADGARLQPGSRVARISGPARGLLTAERTMLNFLGRLSGIATLTDKFVTAANGTRAGIYDTRKTTPGWRLLEKYAVRCGGGRNHRVGLYDAVLIKDNHLAFGTEVAGEGRFIPAEAVAIARGYLASQPRASNRKPIIEIEVENLEQLRAVLTARPEIVLLDNMRPDLLRAAVAIRNKLAPETELEASGGVNLETVRAIAETGVDRISSGALTHSAVVLDLGLDWE